MPSPVVIEKTRVPASYLNFFISNKTVLVPVFNVKEDKKVLKIFRKFFIDRKVAENRNGVEFELSAKMDLDGVRLPKRQVLPQDFPGVGSFFA